VNEHAVHTPVPTVAPEGGVRGVPRADWREPGASLRARRIYPGESLGDVQRLRREVYFQEQGRDDQRRSRRIADGLDASGTVVVVEAGLQAAATLRLHDFASPAVQVEYGRLFEIDRFAEAWPPERVAACTRFAVQADQRVKAVVDALMEEMYRHASENGIQFCLLACEPFLHSVFEHYGFREYLPPAVLPSGVALLRMVLVVDDALLLQECASPLYGLVSNAAAGHAASGWLMRAFPENSAI